MAVAVVAGIAAVGGAAASSFAIAGTLAIGWGAAAASFAIGAGLSVVSRAIAPKPKLNTGASLAGLTATVREPATSKKVVYGRTRIGGTVVYLDTTGTDNKYLHMVIAMAGHEIDAFESVYFNDELVWSGTYRNGWNQFARINFHEGDQTTADSDLVSESTPWTSSHILRDTAYLYVRLQYDADQFPNGIPNISAIVRGKKIYDPRQDSTSSHYDSSVGVSTHRVNDSATWTWSQNPALAVRDYLVDDKYGLGEDAALVNSSALVTAADYCDVDEDSNSDAIPKLEINGIVDTANSRKENIDSMLSSMGGMLVYSGGSYFIRAAQYVSPTITIDESAMVGQIQIQTRQSRRSQYNGVKGVFLSREKNYTVADYPAQISSTYATEDGDPIYLDMALPFVTDNEQAQRLAKVALLKSRQQTVITVPVNLAGLKFKAGDVIQITNERLGYDEKAFEVVDYSIVMEGSGGIRVDLRCIETASSIYDWLSDDAEDFLSGGELTLYDGKTAEPPTSLTATESTRINSDGAVIPTIELAWTAASDAFVDHYEVEWKQSTASTYKTVNTVGTEYEIPVPVVGVTYNTRVRAVNSIGVRSTYATANVTMGGDTTAPAAPTSASTSADVHTLVISWTNPSDLDLSYVEVKRSATSSEGAATVIGRSDGTTFIDGPFTVATTRYYWVRAVDNSGNASSWVSAGSDTTVAVDTDDLADNSVDITKIADTLQSTNYSAGTAGWKLTTNGIFEAGNGTFRGAVTATSGEIGGLTIGSDKIYLGTGTFNNTNTGFYIDDTGQFSLKDKLAFYPSDNTLRVKGNIEADVITVNSNLQVVGDLQASSLAIASITREMFTQDALDEIYGALATAVGGSNGDYQEASGSFTTSGGTVTLALFDHGESDVAVEWLENYGFSQTTDYTGTALQATLTFEASTTSNFATIAASKTETITLGKYDLSSYYGSTYIWYYGPRSVTKTFTTSDLADNTDYYFRVRVTNVGAAFTGQTYPFELEANEGVTGVVSTGGNADTLDNLDSTAFLRSNVDDTFNANLTVTGNLTVQGTTVTLNTATLDVEDKNITLNYGSGDTSGSANGAGITIQDAVNSSTDATILWDATNDEFDFSHPINVGTLYAGNVQATASIGNLTAGSLGQQMEKGDTSVTTLRFDADRWRLYAGNNAGEIIAAYENGNIDFTTGNLLKNGTSWMDNSRNMSNIGTISSGAITSTGTSAFGNFRLTDASKMGFGMVKAGGSVAHTATVDEGIFWHTGNDYGIYRTSGAWSSPNYQQLKIRFITGIELDGGSAYGKSGVNIINSDLQIGGTTVIDSSRNVYANYSLLGRSFRTSGRGELHINSDSTTAVSEIFFGYGNGYAGNDNKIRWGISDRGTTTGTLQFYKGPANNNGSFEAVANFSAGHNRFNVVGGYDVNGTNVINASRGATFDSVEGTRIGVNNTSATTKHGISLYNGYSEGTNPTYGIMFTGTSGSGTHGAVSGDWATYFTMNGTSGRGWVFRNQSTPANVASISNQGFLTATRLYPGDGTDGYFFSDTGGRTAFTGGDFYIQSGVSNYYNYATNQYYGGTSGDNIYFRGNALSGDNWTIETNGHFTSEQKLSVVSSGTHNELLLLRATSDRFADMIMTDNGGSIRLRQDFGEFQVYSGGSANNASASGAANRFEVTASGINVPSGGIYVGGNETISSARHLFNLGGQLRSDNSFDFLTMAGNAQTIQTGGVSAGTNYANTPVYTGEFNAVTGYRLNNTRFLDANRDLSQISNVAVTASDGRGYGFWSSLAGGAYRIYMSSSANSSFGGRVSGETSSDYNMYFKMQSGANRGFVFRDNTNNYFSINPGAVHSEVPLKIGSGNITLDNSADRSGLLDIQNAGQSWTGVQFTRASGDHWSVMGNDANFGAYDDQNGEWIFLHTQNGGTNFYHNGASRLEVTSGGIKVDAGQYSEIVVKGDDNGTAQISLYGDSQGTGRVYVGQSTTYGGGIEYNGDNSPSTTGAGADYITLYRTENGTSSWTARNKYNVNNWEFRGNVTAYASDARLKENVTTITDALEKVQRLRGVEFDWKSECAELGFMPSMKHETGVIAQEVQAVIPDAAFPAPFDSEYLTVQKDKIVPLLIEAIKEQQEQIDELRALIKEIKNGDH